MKDYLKVTTTPDISFKILQELSCHYADGIERVLTQRVLDTQEASTKEALIQLGWTPPPSGGGPVKQIFLDMDGVVCDFFTAAVRQCARGSDKYIESSPGLFEGLLGTCRVNASVFGYADYIEMFYPRGKWDIADTLGISHAEFWSRVDNDDFWSSLSPYPGAREFTEAVSQCGKVTFCTRASDHKGCASAKVRWLHRHLGGACEYIVTGPNVSKALLAKPGTLLIDDNEPNVEEFRAAGGRAILVPRPWNKVGLKDRFDTVDYESVLHTLRFMEVANA